jgi:hypothetical protein
MAAKDNGNWLSGLTNWIREMNAAERQMNLRDAAVHRGADGGQMDETGLPKINFAEWLAGLRTPEDQVGIQRQSSANETAKIVNANLKANPNLQRLPQLRKGGEDDLAYYGRRLAEQDREIAILKAIEGGVPSELVRLDSLTTPAQIERASQTYRDNQDLIKLIQAEELGPKLLATEREKAGGKRLTGDQLAGVLSEARGKDPVRVSNLDTARVERDVATRGAAVAERQQSLLELQRQDTNAQFDSKIDYNNRKLDYDWRNAQAERDYQYSRDEADRDLKKTLTMLGFDDKRDERRERSEERAAEQRQLFILQLMKGLGSLGQSIGGSL